VYISDTCAETIIESVRHERDTDMRAGSMLMLYFVFILNVCGCASMGPALGGALNGASQSFYANTQPRILIFGGHDHTTYLGCMSCSEYAADSIMNKYGQHGSLYSSVSIWNHYSTFGSRYSSESACNRYANDPPVIVDSEGGYYGRLSVNEYHPKLGVGTKYMEFLNRSVCDS
jgi:hypothetical protein